MNPCRKRCYRVHRLLLWITFEVRFPTNCLNQQSGERARLLRGARTPEQHRSKLITFIGWPHQTGRKQRRTWPNRSIITRLRKCAPDFQFQHYAEGDLLTHIEKKSDHYLSCVFTIIREWHVRGKPRTHETSHDFREWSQSLDWIIQNIFRLPPLLDGHRDEQLRISSPGLSFLRDVALVVEIIGDCGKDLSATDLALLCDAASLEVPGNAPGAEIDKTARRVGSIFAPLFRASDKVTVEGFEVTKNTQPRKLADRGEFRDTKFYCFNRRALN
jgi:hypothetical protein